MATPSPIRPITEDELLAVITVHGHAFHTGPPSDEARARLHGRVEYDRTIAAFDGAAMVGVAGAYSFRMRVPGALAAVAGVTLVGVLPSHRRRGILASLMREQLDDVHDRGEAVAALFASEAGIYGRFGYGRASWQAAFRQRRAVGPAGGRRRCAHPAPLRVPGGCRHRGDRRQLCLEPGQVAAHR
jgi:predicted N-acetyltransferase YhbS